MQDTGAATRFFLRHKRKCWLNIGLRPADLYYGLLPREVSIVTGDQMGAMTSGERGVPLSVVCAVQALGNIIPPFFVFRVNATRIISFRVGKQGMPSNTSG